MSDNSNYIPLSDSQNEDSNDEAAEIVQVLELPALIIAL